MIPQPESYEFRRFRLSILMIWDIDIYLYSNQELNHQFIDEPLSISIHPSGIFICILFLNIIQIYVYTIDGLNLFKQFQIFNVQIVYLKYLIKINYFIFINFKD